MITSKYSRPETFSSQVRDILYDAGEALTRRQGKIAKTYYRRRSGELQKNLDSRPVMVSSTAVSARLVVNYLVRIKYLDLRKSVRGRKKKVYAQIYNRWVYGYMLGYAYGRLRYGLTKTISDTLSVGLREAFRTLK